MRHHQTVSTMTMTSQFHTFTTTKDNFNVKFLIRLKTLKTKYALLLHSHTFYTFI